MGPLSLRDALTARPWRSPDARSPDAISLSATSVDCYSGRVGAACETNSHQRLTSLCTARCACSATSVDCYSGRGGAAGISKRGSRRQQHQAGARAEERKVQREYDLLCFLFVADEAHI